MDTHPPFLRPLAAALGLAAVLEPALARADMLSGGLLGSVLRGDEFTGPRLIDLLAIGVLLFLVLRLVLNRPGASPRQSPPPDATPDKDDIQDDKPAGPPPGKPNMYTNAQATWDALKSPSAQKPATPTPNLPGSPPANATPDEEFLAGAKMAYSRIRASMAHRDFDDLAAFTTPAFLNQLRTSLPASPPPQPDILLIEATLAGRREEGSTTVMDVAYNVLIHEAGAPHNTDRAERWRFVRDNAVPGANWLLDGVQ